MGLMESKIFRVDCFACKEVSENKLVCSALQLADCRGCKFFKTEEDYNKNVKPLKREK